MCTCTLYRLGPFHSPHSLTSLPASFLWWKMIECFVSWALSHFLDVCFFDRLNSVLANRFSQCLGEPPGCYCWPMLTGVLADSRMLGIIILTFSVCCAACTCLLASDISLGCRTSDRGPLGFARSSRHLIYRRMDTIIAQLDCLQD